jgi:glycosyltransferase involved in cell wall biosynthesis
MKLLITTQIVDKNDPILGFFHGWVTEFAQHFERIDVVCLKEGVHDLPAHVHIHSLGKEGGESNLKYLVRFYYFFTKIFFGTRVDYVFFHMGAIYNILAFPFFLIRKSFNTKFYWWKAHGHINWVGRLALRFVDRVYTSTESGFSIPTKKRVVVGQAIDTTLFVLDNVHGTAHEKNEIIFVGRITPIKRIEDFIHTISILHKKGISCTGTIVGPVLDPNYFIEMQRLVESLQLTENIRFVGTRTQEELVPLYTKAGFFLNTSMTQSMDKVVLEAALSGVVPVTGNRAFKDLLTPYSLYVENATPELYAETIMTASQNDTNELAQKLRETVAHSHSLHTFTQRIFGI